VNRHLGEAAVDYERDVLPLAPSGNATERHMLVAYERRAEEAFPDELARRRYWAAKLGEDERAVSRLMRNSVAFRELVRRRLMKRGGVGYVQPERGSFPALEEMVEMASSCGAMPTFTWLDGTSRGEEGAARVVEFHVSKGASAVNIIPDRNWNLKDPRERELKTRNLHELVAAATERDVIIVSGTELNKHGLPFADDLGCEALAPVAGPIRRGALALYGHTAMARFAGKPILGRWAREAFGDDLRARNEFYADVGRLLEPGPSAPERLGRACEASVPNGVLEALRAP
jgi:hypothetical protein